MATSVKKTLDPETAQVLATGLKSVRVQNLGPYPVWIGGSGVSTENGYSLPAGSAEVFALDLAGLESLYGISESGNSDVRVLTTTGGL